MEEKLIEVVKAYPILYDKRHPEYRRIDKKDKVWREISISLKAEESKCRMRWKTLRDQFIRELRMTKQPSGSAAVDRKKWKYFDLLLFLKDSSLPKKTSSNFECEENMTAELSEIFEIDRSMASTSQQHSSEFNFMLVEEDTSFENLEDTTSSNPAFSLPRMLNQRSSTPSQASTSSCVDIGSISTQSQTSSSHVNDRRSSSTPSQQPSTSRRVRQEDTSNDHLREFLKDLIEEVRKPEESNSLDSFFQSLSTLINSMNLSPLNLLDLQSKILIFVKKELEKYNN